MRLNQLLIIATVAATLATAAPASTTTVSGSLTDSTNAALISSNGYQDLSAPQFGNDDLSTLNIAVYSLVVTTGGTIQFTSTGAATGGIEPYLTIFTGSGPSAMFFDSSYFDPNLDPSLTESLAAGTYLIAISVWENMSFAEQDLNFGPAGALSEGYTTLVDSFRVHDGTYALDVTSEDSAFTTAPATGLIATGPSGGSTVPEPDVVVLLGIGLTALFARRGFERRTSSHLT